MSARRLTPALWAEVDRLAELISAAIAVRIELAARTPDFDDLPDDHPVRAAIAALDAALARAQAP